MSSDAGRTEYLYNSLGQRVAKLSGQDDDDRNNFNDQGNAGNTYYAYDTQGRLIGEYSADHSRSTEYVWVGNAPVAVLKKEDDGPARLYYVYTDQLNTPRQIVDSTNNELVWQWYGEPFGTSMPDQDPGKKGRQFNYNLRYAGQYYDRESNLFHNGFRDYNPQIGRYVESDPIGLGGGINTYAYVGGNPVSYTDPQGTCPWCLVGGFVVGAGANIVGSLIAGQTPSFSDAATAGLGGVIAVAGAGEIVAGTIVGGVARVGAGIIGDLGFQLGFNSTSVPSITPPAHGETLPNSSASQNSCP